MLFFLAFLLQSPAPPAPKPAPAPAPAQKVAPVPTAPKDPQAAAAPAAPKDPEPKEMVAAIPGTKILIRLDVPGFTTEERHAQAMKQALGARGVFVGVLAEEKASLELVVDEPAESQAHMTDAEWRDYNLKDSGSMWKYFDLPGMLGGESTILFEGSGSHDFHAFTVRAGRLFDFHMSESFDAVRKPRISRARFVEFATTLRLAVVRYGSFGTLPPRAVELMDQAFQRGVGGLAYLVELAKASPDDYAIPFAAGEVARALGKPSADQLPSYAKAVELLAAKTQPAEAERVARAVAEVGLAFACLEAADPDKVAPHFDEAQKAAADLPPVFKGGVLYDRACAEARQGHPEPALEHLREAARSDPGAMQRAIHEKDLAPVRELPWFKNFLAGDRDNR